MYQAEEDQMRKFWTATQDFWLKLYQYPLTTIAAINVSYIKETKEYN